MILPTEPNGEASSVHAHQMTEFAYFLRRGFRNCEILCNPTKVPPCHDFFACIGDVPR